MLTNILKALGWISLGAAGGSAVTYFIVNKKANDRVNDELARLDAQYKPQNTSNPHDDTNKEASADEELSAEDLIDKASYDKYETIIEDKNYAKKSTKKPKKVKKANDIVSDTPYIIDPGLWEDDKLDYEKMKLTYFEKEDAFLDNRTDHIYEDGRIIFGDYVDEPNNWTDEETMWVRNDKYKMDAEITLNDEESIYDYCEEDDK